MVLSKEQKFNRAFNYFLVIGLTVAVTISTIYKLQEPDAKVFPLLLAAFGSIMGVLSTVLSANGNIMTFIFGFLDVLIGTIIYYENGIMGNFALHAFYFLPMQFIGFWQWSKRGAKMKSRDGDSAQVKARRLNGKQAIILIFSLMASIAVMYLILLYVDKLKLNAGKIEYIDNWKILLDSVVMMANIAGQVLMSLAFVEQWYLWLVVDVASVSLWIVALCGPSHSASALVMAIKYFFYLLNVLNGIRIWLKLSKTSN